MRKNFSFFAFITLSVLSLCLSCAKEESIEAPCEDNMEQQVRVRSDVKFKDNNFEVTKDMALLFANSLQDKTEIVDVDTYNYEGIPCLYIINYEQGWKVIPADSRVQPLLGESTSGSLDIESLDNPGVKLWLIGLAESIVKIKECGVEDYNTEITDMWKFLREMTQKERSISRQLRDTSSEGGWIKITNTTTSANVVANVDHLLPTKWGQRYPWNISLPEDPNAQGDIDPRFATGCVPTAVAQVLYYFHQQTGYPNDLWHSLSVSNMSGNGPYTLSLDRSNHVINSSRWNSMPLIAPTLSPYLDTDLIDSTACGYVSDLMMDVGVRMGASYSKQMTGTPFFYSWDLNPCGITCSAGSYDYSTVRSNLLNGKPIIIDATSPSLGCSHVWVIDGCYDKTITTTVTSQYFYYRPGYSYPSNATYLTESEMLALYPNAYDGMSVVESTTQSYVKYLLMNYGWDGEYDSGYYNIEGTNWAESFHNDKRIYYNLSAGQLN